MAERHRPISVRIHSFSSLPGGFLRQPPQPRPFQIFADLLTPSRGSLTASRASLTPSFLSLTAPRRHLTASRGTLTSPRTSLTPPRGRRTSPFSRLTASRRQLTSHFSRRTAPRRSQTALFCHLTAPRRHPAISDGLIPASSLPSHIPALSFSSFTSCAATRASRAALGRCEVHHHCVIKRELATHPS